MQTVKRVRVISLCLVVVLLGLGLLAGATTAKAQENNTAPPSPQKAAEPAAPPSTAPEKPVDSARRVCQSSGLCVQARIVGTHGRLYLPVFGTDARL